MSSQWDDSEAAQFLTAKLNNFREKFEEASSTKKNYNAYANQKYLSRIEEASYIKYKDKCALLWFSPFAKKEKAEDTTPIASLATQPM